jgi:hypothetical protein
MGLLLIANVVSNSKVPWPLVDSLLYGIVYIRETVSMSSSFNVFAQRPTDVILLFIQCRPFHPWSVRACLLALPVAGLLFMLSTK